MATRLNLLQKKRLTAESGATEVSEALPVEVIEGDADNSDNRAESDTL